MGKFFNKTAEEKRKSHAGTGAAVGGAAMAGNQANWVRKVNKKGTKERKAYKSMMGIILKGHGGPEGAKQYKKMFKKGWTYGKGRTAAAVALSAGIGAAGGAAVGSLFKKKNKNK